MLQRKAPGGPLGVKNNALDESVPKNNVQEKKNALGLGGKHKTVCRAPDLIKASHSFLNVIC